MAKTSNIITTGLKMTIAAMFVTAIVVVQGCGCDPICEPPISATFRSSLLTGYVLQLHNRADKRIVANVHVQNEAKNHSRSISVGIAPNDMTELGVLEMDWCFEPGESGYIDVDGYRRKVYFEIHGRGQYKTWTGL